MMKLHTGQNGTFFTDPIKAGHIFMAFAMCLRGLVGADYLSKAKLLSLIPANFKKTLMCHGETVMSFMEKRMVAAVENDVRMIFCLFDHGGWRFFGRV
jgi:hypothetical protein